MSDPVSYLPLTQCSDADKARLLNIFWATATKTQFSSAQEKLAFQSKYFTDYCDFFPDSSFALKVSEQIQGYILGCPNTQRALEKGQLQTALYPHEFLHHLQKYPAHLHIDLDPTAQGKGLGKNLIMFWMHQMKLQRVPAFHIVTVVEHPSYVFYTRLGLADLERLPRGVHELVIMGQSLA